MVNPRSTGGAAINDRFFLQVSLGIEEGIIQAYNLDFELQWSHKLSHVTRFSTLDGDAGYSFLYLYREDEQRLLYCYLFQAVKQSDVSFLFSPAPGTQPNGTRSPTPQFRQSTPPRRVPSPPVQSRACLRAKTARIRVNRP